VYPMCLESLNTHTLHEADVRWWKWGR